MPIKLQAIDDIRNRLTAFINETIKNVQTAEIPASYKGFKRQAEKARYEGRIEALEATKKAFDAIVLSEQEKGGFR
jgi:hypothetical protein